jgi:hypothetical protein
MNDESNLRTVPKNLSTIMGMVVKTWTKTNPEAIRNLFKWNQIHANFLFKNPEDQKTYMEKNKLGDFKKDKETHVNKQIDLLRSNGMLPNIK